MKPICLWTSTSSYDDLIGKKGVVAGWGKTEFDAVSTAQPNWASLPVVSESTCLRSNDAFSALTSSRTFCAGDRNGKTGPCLGDSGKERKKLSFQYHSIFDFFLRRGFCCSRR